MNSGWIKLYRSITELAEFNEKPFDRFHALVDILLSVNHTEHEFYSKGVLIKLQPWQMITSIQILADRWGWSVNKVRRFIRQLNRQGIAHTNGTAHGTTLTVDFTGFEALGRRTNGIANERADGTTDGIADGTLYKNVKNVKNEKNIYSFERILADSLKPMNEEAQNDR